MTNGLLGEVAQAIIIGVGDVGQQVLTYLDRRLIEEHNGIPTVKLLVLIENELEQSHLEGDAGEIQWLNLAYDVGGLFEKRKSAIIRWLPSELLPGADEGPQQIAGSRIQGRLALFQHADLLHRTVREARHSVVNVANRHALEQRRLRVKDESSLDVYVIAALNEPFASGVFLDLSYLVAHTLAQELPDRVFYHTTGMLFLPRFDGDGPAEAAQQQEAEVVRQADTYATLKELDHYMDRRRYECHYHDGLSFTMQSPPFTRACYLVDAVNERNKGLPDLKDAVVMTGEWLYQMLASPLKDSFQEQGIEFADIRSYGKVAAYSGLGLACYVLPIKEVIEICAERLALEMIHDYFLREAIDDGQDPTADFGASVEEVEKQLGDDTAWDDKIAAYVNVPPQHFANIAPTDLTRLEGGIRRRFGYLFDALRPRLRRGMDHNLGEILAQTENRISERVAHIINTSPTGGVSQGLRFLDKLKSDFVQAEQKVRDESKEARKHLQEAEEAIKVMRAGHVSAVKTIDSRRALIGLGLTVLCSLWLLYYAHLAFVEKLEEIPLLEFGQTPLIAFVVVLLGTLLTLGVVGKYAWDWFGHSRESYIDSHRRKLRDGLEIYLKEAAAHYYKLAQQSVDEQLGEVARFRDLLENLRDDLAAVLKADRPLYGSPHFALEESVLTSQDVDRFYKERVEETLEDEIAALFADYGPFYKWKDVDVAEIKGALLAFGRQKMELLKQTKSAELLLMQHAMETPEGEGGRLIDKVSTAELGSLDNRLAVQRRLKRLRDHSMPFLRYSDLELEVGVTPNLVHAMGVESALYPASMVNEILEELQIQRVSTNNRHAIISMAVRHGLPLAAIGVLGGYKAQYDMVRNRELKPLHTQRRFLALPDVFPISFDGKEVMEPWMAVALGTAYPRIIRRREEDEQYTFRYKNEWGETVEAELGTEKIQVCVSLQSNPHLLQMVSERIDQETVKRSERSKRGNRAVIDYLRRYLKKNLDELEDWEEVMIEEYVNRLAA